MDRAAGSTDPPFPSNSPVFAKKYCRCAMLPSAITLSLDLADVENCVPWGRMNPRRRAATSDRADEDVVDEDPDEAVDWRSADNRGEVSCPGECGGVLEPIVIYSSGVVWRDRFGCLRW